MTAVLFTLTLRAASKSDAPPVGLLSLASQTRLAPAISAIFNFPERPWNIHDLANLCNMSRATFMRHFKEMSGRSAMDFLTDIRANLAANELKNPETSIEKVAESVGYQSTSAFRRIFVNKIGMTAGQWRRISRA